MSIYEASITNPRKQLEFYKDLSEQLKQENKRLNGAIQTYDILLKSNVEANKQLKLINQEHQQINGQLRQANKLLNEQYIRLYKDYIQLKAQIEEYQKALDETMYEKIDIESNWNKLKEYINKYIKYDNYGRKISKCLNSVVIMNKINKLEKGGDNDE